MKALTIKTVLMTYLLMLISCGSSKENPVSLEVSGGFSITSAGYTGGLLAHGIGPNGAKFSASAGTGTTINTKIVDGNWKIFIVGYDGATSFTGTKYCGSTEVNLGATDSNININIDTTKCLDAAFQAEVGLFNVFTTSCGAFYTYNSLTDVYSAPTTDAFCSTLPHSFKYSHTHYKIIALNHNSEEQSSGLSSECLSTDSGSIVRRALPTLKFPFRIQTYPSLAECQSSTNAQVASFNFPHGLSAGNAEAFDHEFSSLSSNARLALPSSMTRRGRSPFMNMIPGIFCGSTSTSLADCISAPTTNLSHVHVPFHDNSGGDEAQLLLRGVKNNVPIPGSFLSSMTRFNVSDLQIKEGNLFGRVSRNKFLCQAQDEFSGITDIYTSNNLVYVLYTDATNSWIKVFNLKGKELNSLELSSLYYHIAAATDGTLYVANSSSIKKYSYSGGAYTNTLTKSGTSIQGMELSGSGAEIVVAEYVSGYNYLVTYQTSDLATSLGSNQIYTSPMKQMQMVGTELYFYAGSGFKKATLASNGLSSATSLTNPPDQLEAFSINGGDVYGFTNANSVYRIEKYSLSNLSAAAVATSATLSFNNMGTSPKQLLFIDGKVFFADRDNRQLQIFDPTLTTANSPQIINNSCTETAVASLGTATESLTLISKPDDSIFRLFEAAFESVGVRFIADQKNIYAFREFRPHGYEVRTGGVLGQAQQMMGPDGIASFVSEFSDCNALKTALSSASGQQITRTRTLVDIVNNTSDTYTGVFSKINQDISNPFYCKDNTLTGSCATGSDIFDIQIAFYNSGSSYKEVSKMRLSCGRKVGTFESLEKESPELRREFLSWNTGDYTKARYEKYAVDVESQYRAQLQKLVKSGANSLWSRSIFTHEDSNYMQGSTREFHVSAGNAMTRAFHLSDTLANFLGSHSSQELETGILFDTIRDSNSMSSASVAPLACAASTNVDMQTANACSGVNFQAFSEVNMSGTAMDLNISDASGISDPNHAIWGVFTIPEP